MPSPRLRIGLHVTCRKFDCLYWNARITRKFVSSDASSPYENRRREFAKEIDCLPESRASHRLFKFLECKTHQNPLDQLVASPVPPPGGYQFELSETQIRHCLDAMLATFCLHVESRIASLIGQGFYTIGPCGEEALSSIGCAVMRQDSLALHYRHMSANITRQLVQGASLGDIILDRARAYTVSRDDPVTGGVHCSIGSDPSQYKDPGAGDFIVTSTLSSQCSPAVGRALGYSLRQPRHSRSVSMVTLGDGSVHNHHFWSAFHLSRHARHKHVKCPVVFGVSDNGLSISYKTGGYVDSLFGNDPLVPLFRVNGNDVMDVYDKTMSALVYARTMSAPVVILYKNIIRRFGHAATDRQQAYLDTDDIRKMADNIVLESSIQQIVEVLSATSYAEVRDRLFEIEDLTRTAFALVSQEEKVTRSDMLNRVSAPAGTWHPTRHQVASSGPGKRDVMRKQMNRVIAEVMEEDETVIYLGEDVCHGGYYVVTEGIEEKFPGRIIDFPPDETSLLGAAMGFSQVGLTPIVEIPYAKYLDCGADMFYEIAISNWLSNGKCKNGMIIRLQGFGRGLFGGNFHTTNILPHAPPGVDVVCYSNGEDYVRGFRNAIAQAQAGRVVMIVDCTSLLNLRHLHGKDREWERAYPEPDENGSLGFDEVRCYGKGGKFCIVTFGNGVVTVLQARLDMYRAGVIEAENDVDIVDCPYISSLPEGLADIISRYEGVLFVDICKEGPGGSIMPAYAAAMRQRNILPEKWQVLMSPRTYNPLGSICTFLNTTDITEGFERLKSQT